MSDETTHPDGSKGAPSEELQSMSGCLLRIYWSLAGPAIAFVSLLVVGLQGESWGGIPDIVSGALAMMCCGARHLDNPELSPSRRAYWLFGLSIWSGLWLVAHLLEPRML